MKVHLNQIPPEGRRFEGEDPNTILELEGSDYTTVSPVGYTLDIGISEGGLFATGHIGVDLECTCVNCLERFTLPVDVENFAIQVEDTGSDEIDLTEPMREDILLALPAHPRCDWSGERTCPGVSRPTESPSSKAEDSSSDVWTALDQLKIK